MVQTLNNMKEPNKYKYGFNGMWPDKDSEQAFDEAYSTWHAKTNFMKTDKIAFNEACAKYVHRFTMEHVPQWASEQREDGTYYAPHYRSDREWYDNTLFPPHEFTMSKKDTSCHSTNQTWPLGKALDKPYHK